MSKSLKRLISALLALLCLFGLSSCTDLGDFEDEEAFYAAFGDICFVSSSNSKFPEIRKYDLDEITNKETQRDNKTVMPEDYYKYIIFENLDDITADDLSFWFLTEKEFDGRVSMEIYLSSDYVTEYFPNINQHPYAGRYEKKTSDGLAVTVEQLNFDGYGKVDDGNGNSATYTQIKTATGATVTFTLSATEGGSTTSAQYTCQFDKPYNKVSVKKNVGGFVTESEYKYVSEYETTPEAGLTQLIAKGSAYAERGKWSSFFVEEWVSGDTTSTRMDIAEDKYFYIKILNNCSGAERNGLSPIAFRANNLMLRVV